MKNTLAFLFFTSIIISSCSSPEKEGKNIGIKYCNCLGEIKLFSKIPLLKHRSDSCEDITKNDWSKYETEYKLDAEKWKQFTSGYNNTTQKTFEEYNSKIISLMDAISASNNKIISADLWVKEGENNTDFPLVKFENNSLKEVNCKGEIAYKLFADTIKFTDKSNTNLILEFTSDKKMIISDLDHKYKSVYHRAEVKDKIIGRWNAANAMVIAFYANGSCAMGGGDYSLQYISFTYKDNVLNLKGVAYKISLTNMDGFNFGQAYFKRIKSKLPENVDFLFKNIN
jgi:hypothetical protein